MGVETVGDNTRMTLRVAGQNGASDTTFTVVTTSEGVVKQIEMRVQVAGQNGQPEGQTIIIRAPDSVSSNSVWMRVPDPNNPNQTIPMQAPAASYYVQQQDERGRTIEVPIAPVQGDRYYNALFTSLPNVLTNFVPGQSTSVVSQYSEQRAAMNLLVSTIQSDYQAEMAERSRIIGERVPHNIIDRAANIYAAQSLESTLHLSTSELVERIPRGSMEPAAVVAAIHAAYSHSFGSDEFASRLASSSALGNQNQADILRDAISQLSPESLRGTRAAVGSALLDHLDHILIAHPELKQDVTRLRESIESADRGAVAAIDIIRNTSNDFHGSLIDSRVPPGLSGGLLQGSTSSIAALSAVGESLDPSVRYSDNAGSILARADLTTLPGGEDVRRQIAPFTLLAAGSNSLNMLNPSSDRPADLSAQAVAIANSCTRQNEVYATAITIASEEGHDTLGQNYNATAEASHHFTYSTSVIAATGYAPREGQLEEATSSEHQRLETLRTTVESQIRSGNLQAAQQTLEAYAQRAQMLGDEHAATIALNALAAVSTASNQANFNANEPIERDPTNPSPPSYSEARRFDRSPNPEGVFAQVSASLSSINETELAQRVLFNQHMVESENSHIQGITSAVRAGDTERAFNQLEQWRSQQLEQCRLNGSDTSELERTYTQARDAIISAPRQSEDDKIAYGRTLESENRTFEHLRENTVASIAAGYTDTSIAALREYEQRLRAVDPHDGNPYPSPDAVRRAVEAAESARADRSASARASAEVDAFLDQVDVSDFAARISPRPSRDVLRHVGDLTHTLSSYDLRNNPFPLANPTDYEAYMRERHISASATASYNAADHSARIGTQTLADIAGRPR